MTSEIRVNKLTNRIGLSTVTFADSGIGVTVTGRIDPDTDSARDLGTTSVRWRNVYADTLYGDGSNLTGISGGTSLSGSTNNTVCTVTGANAIQGESTLTYDGNKLKFGGGTRTLDNGYYDDIVIDNSDISSGANGGSGISLISGSSSWCGLIFGDVDEHQQAYVKYSNQSEYMQIHAPSAGYISFDTGSERLRITSTGKIGIGVVPSAWDTTTTSKVLQVGNSCIFDYNNGDYFHVGHNFYWDGSNYKYIANDSASRFLQNDGQFTFYQAASGTANNNITWNQRLKITSSGDYGFNDTSPTAHASGNNTVLSIKGKGSSYSGKIDFKDSDGNIDSYINSDNAILQFYADPNSQNGNTSMLFYVHGGERFRFGRHGQIGIGGANYGTAGQVLKSGGASAAPTWGSAGSETTEIYAYISFGTTYDTNSGYVVQDISSLQSGSGITVDNSNERVTPTVAGKYLFMYMCNWLWSFSGGATFYNRITKNGSEQQRSTFSKYDPGSHTNITMCVMTLNGSSDYVQFEGYENKSGQAAYMGNLSRAVMFKLRD